MLQEVASVRNSSCRALLNVFFEQLLGSLLYLRGSSRFLLRSEGASLAGYSGVALETEERLTSNRRAAWDLEMLRSRA